MIEISESVHICKWKKKYDVLAKWSGRCWIPVLLWSVFLYKKKFYFWIILILNVLIILMYDKYMYKMAYYGIRCAKLKCSHGAISLLYIPLILTYMYSYQCIANKWYTSTSVQNGNIFNNHNKHFSSKK